MIIPKDTIIASGPVIIEDGKVLLDKEQKDSGVTPWLFPGGRVDEKDDTFEQTAIREVKEELGVDIEIIRPLRTLLKKRTDQDSFAILIHYLAKRTNGVIMLGEDIAKYGWHDIHDLPNDCAPNVYEIIQDVTNGSAHE
jgi:8-oxo-dGTP diphosphatase